ncbi:hypothetical protein GCM10007103_34750 [Salinimicrobium marinum]|uniref:DUF2267 domain-containing protein n=1 Tax=Salinimicrobium marinum TaxID=680283 RepID=A0A918W0K2_9FLAO|nr:DUF2267 domain-containing protein [Salinimicrobium marinum]GHA51215.1 hypothetical protein GCM10007103_34750 [Salinimicrobium marinum]
MKKVVNLVAQRAGISESQAKTAVDTVASFIKDKLPAGMQSQVDKYLSEDENSSDRTSGMGDKLGDILGNK